MSNTHGLMAAGLLEREAELFDGTSEEAFLYAVRDHVGHGYPLSQTGRRAAAKRIIASHPHLSDRAIAQIAGLGAKTVAALRGRSDDQAPAVEARVGRDGRVRPVNGAAGRLRAAELLAEHPHASLRELARMAGVSPATVSDVRKRLNAGLGPVPGRQAAGRDRDRVGPADRRSARRGAEPASRTGGPGRAPASAPAEWARPAGAARPTRQPHPSRPGAPADPMAVNAAAMLLTKLARDPSLRQHDTGRRLLVLLQSCTTGARDLNDLVEVVPPHCTNHMKQLAHQVAQMWLDFARELNQPGAVG
ncbi:putative transcriptional regulator [Actinacidiphila reveromycinica]|uniref:Putative transcriptional regulator n=1 Tax=Actinacidiphila reveromycinica TaxID=659352 RepID=A0A7U3V121_9ACTN|nr:transcriptional regulator [Streptomyces sp. SN-593]BBB02244.1 putative transcriptional regulator [Streptomyces sp. SN-593]